MRSVALDWGSRISLCEVSQGRVNCRATVGKLDELRRYIGPGTAPARVAIECCREAWFIAETLRQWGHEPVLVDTTRVRKLGIGQHGRKNDRIDAELLAIELEKNNIPRAHELSRPRQELRMASNARAQLVGARSTLYTAVKGNLRARGVELPKRTPQDFVSMVGRALAGEQHSDLRELVEPLLKTLATLEEQILQAEKLVDRLSAQEPNIELLKTRPGVGAVVAAAFVSVIDDPHRFENTGQVGSYIGLVPSENTSVKRRLGAITKQGNAYLRAMLVQAAWTVLRIRGDDPLTVWGKAIAGRRGKHIAAVAVARRLAGILWAMWRDDRVYDPKRLGAVSAEGLLQHAEEQFMRAQALRAASKKKLPKLRAGARLGTRSAASPL